MRNKIKDNFKDILTSMEKELNFIIDKESKNNTPERLTKMYLNELLIGYTQSPKQILSKTFDTSSRDMVVIDNIPFVSLCSHHWLPFIGTIAVGYIPDKKVVGLSKIPRIVNCFTRRFQIQENMTAQIADAIQKYLKPKGCIVICKAQHLCAQIRGVQAHGTTMTTSALRGAFEDEEIKNEFIKLAKL